MELSNRKQILIESTELSLKWSCDKFRLKIALYLGPVCFNYIFLDKISSLAQIWLLFLTGRINISFNLFQGISYEKSQNQWYRQGTHSFRIRMCPTYRCLVLRIADFSINYSIWFTVEVDAISRAVCQIVFLFPDWRQSACMSSSVTVWFSYIDKLLLLGTPRSCSLPDCEIEAGCYSDCWYGYTDENWWQQFLTVHNKIKGFLQPCCWQEIKDAGKPFCSGKESWEQHVLCFTVKKAVN